MRRLTRPGPPDWYESFCKKGMQELSGMIEDAGDDGIAAGYLHDILLYRAHKQFQQIRKIFSNASHWCCYMCETREDPEAVLLDLEHYRPKQFASNQLKSIRNPLHYWWLIYDWGNLQMLCATCARYKKTQFPIRGKRAPLLAAGLELQQEEPLLLNPFDDDPTNHFVLVENGSLKPRSERGEETISLFRLNRKELLVDRSKLYRQIKSDLSTKDLANQPNETEKAQVIQAFIQDWRGRRAGTVELALLSLIKVRRRKSIHTRPDQWTESASTKEYDGLVWLESVVVKNFCLFADFELHFHAPGSALEPWLALIGENGVGKSSFLKAIALALSSSDTIRDLVPDARTIFNRNTRQRTGFVEVRMNNGMSRRISFNRNSKAFTVAGQDIVFPVIALGANRITTRKGSAKNLPTAGALNNLFDPVLPLVDIEEWLTDTKSVSSQQFNQFTLNLKYLLELDVGDRITRLKGKIYIRQGAAREDLSAMSDGFRSVVGLVAHIMKHLAKDTTVMSEAEGTVLLDEIESHLHPTWKIRIVAKLRRLYPHVRFIISTHDPLCLYGLQDQEAFLLKRNSEGDNIEKEPLPLKGGLDVDWLLTNMFGLGSTLDSKTEDMLYDYSSLALRRDLLKLREDRGLPEDEQQEFARLRAELRKRMPEFAGTVSEAKNLAEAALGKVAFAPDDPIDQSAIASRIRQAFNKQEQG